MTLPILKQDDPWFSTAEVADGIWCLTEPHVVEFMQSNIWFLRGRDADLLVDTGNGIGTLGSALPAHDPARLIVVATHAHADHAGGLAEFPGIRCHANIREALETASSDATLAGPGYALDTIAGLLVPPPGLSGHLADAQPYGFKAGDFGPRPCTVSGTLTEGDTIDLGDRRFSVLEVPGHSPACKALWDAEDGLLISGDAIYDDGLVDDLHHSDRAVYRNSLRRLMSLPVTRALGGHGQPMTGPQMRKLIQRYLDG